MDGRRVEAKAAVVLVGDEILEGRRQDLNGRYLAAELSAIGIPLAEIRVVSDAEGALEAALSDLRRRVDLIAITGGLGPTRDDCTRFELARTFGRPIARDPEAERLMAAYFEKLGRVMIPANLVQADLPRGAVPLPNPAGTACGIWIEEPGLVIASMPGVPREMQAIWTQSVRPRWRERGRHVASRRFFTWDLPESRQEALMEGLSFAPGVGFCSLPSRAGVEIQVSCRTGAGGAASPTEADAAVEEAFRALLGRLGDRVVQPVGSPLVEGLLAAVRGARLRLAFCESCTGGLASQFVSRVPGASDVLWGGAVTYSNALKTRLAGVEPDLIERHGAVSREVALDMARAGSRWSEGGLGLAATGIAGPGGGTAEKPVGTVWIAAATPWGEEARELRLRGERYDIQEAAAWQLLGLGYTFLGRGGVG